MANQMGALELKLLLSGLRYCLALASFTSPVAISRTISWMESYLGTLWINPATATVHQRLMGNVPIMESVGKCV
jgi:hypothetical protein